MGYKNIKLFFFFFWPLPWHVEDFWAGSKTHITAVTTLDL